jgi:hypothetical protein
MVVAPPAGQPALASVHVKWVQRDVLGDGALHSYNVAVTGPDVPPASFAQDTRWLPGVRPASAPVPLDGIAQQRAFTGLSRAMYASGALDHAPSGSIADMLVSKPGRLSIAVQVGDDPVQRFFTAPLDSTQFHGVLAAARDAIAGAGFRDVSRLHV